MANHNENGTTVIGAPNSYANSLQTGCGRSTHVIGTNGGTMPCGARFNGEPYYCASCEEKRRLFWSPLKAAIRANEQSIPLGDNMSHFEVTVIGWCWAGYKASTSYVFDHKPTEGEIKDKAGDFSQIIGVRIVENRYSSRLVQEFESEESEEFILNEY